MALKTVQRLEAIAKITPKEIVDFAYPIFRQETPKRSGNARRNTTKDGDSINAQYPYAQRLDQGYSSQSPKGMVQPTIQAIRQYIRKKIG